MHSEIAAIGGKAWAVAMECWNNARRNGGVNNSVRDQAINLAIEDIKIQKNLLIEQGREIPDWEQAYASSIEPRVAHAIKKYVEKDPVSAFSILDVELELTDWGRARIDLGVSDESGISVLDYKYKLRLDARYYDKEVNSYKNSWQQYHYSWAYGEYKGTPIQKYIICLVVTEPKFSVQLHEFPIHPETMLMWKQSAELYWRDMMWEDEGMIKPRMAITHEDKWGPCEYQRACFEHRFDLLNMQSSGDYVIVKPVD